MNFLVNYGRSRNGFNGKMLEWRTMSDVCNAVKLAWAQPAISRGSEAHDEKSIRPPRDPLWSLSQRLCIQRWNRFSSRRYGIVPHPAEGLKASRQAQLRGRELLQGSVMFAPSLCRRLGLCTGGESGLTESARRQLAKRPV